MIKKTREKKLLVLDAFGGGFKTGDISPYNRRSEKEIALKFCISLGQLLSRDINFSKEWDIELIRSEDIFVPETRGEAKKFGTKPYNYNKQELMKRKKPDFFLSFRANKIKGVEKSLGLLIDLQQDILKKIKPTKESQLVGNDVMITILKKYPEMAPKYSPVRMIKNSGGINNMLNGMIFHFGNLLNKKDSIFIGNQHHQNFIIIAIKKAITENM